MNRFCLLLLIVAPIASVVPVMSQQTITGTFEVDESAVNGFIAIQYSQPSFPREFSGSIGGFTYRLLLGQPRVEFVPNFMRMRAHLRAETNIGNFDWDISPSIYINNSISLEDVVALLQDFPQYVNTYLANAPQWLRDVIIQHYQNLNLIVYPGKILEFAESYVPPELAIQVSNVGLDPIVSLQGKVSITAFLTVRGIPPTYLGYTQNRNLFKVRPNVAVNVKQIVFADVAYGTIYWQWTGTVSIPKGGEYTFQFHCDQRYGDNCSMLPESQTSRVIKVLFESARGRFLHVYRADYMPINYQWQGPLAIWSGWD
jgi:hypothetical protein